MRKFPIYILLAVLAAAFGACGTGGDDSDNWKDYKDWREAGEAFITEQEARTNPDGSPYYTKLVPVWDPEAYVLIHYFNDRELTKGNLSPLFTSTVDVKYYGKLYTDEPFDSSYTSTSPADSIYRVKCNGVIEGWSIALEDMRCGDTCEVVIPYQCGYGSASSGSVIKPYSTLVFGIKLVDIPYYEVNQ